MDDTALDLPNLQALKNALAEKPDALALLEAMNGTRAEAMQALATQVKEWSKESSADENIKT